MTYEEAVQSRVSKEEALREVAYHGADWDAFLEEMGDRQEYSGKEVLQWLGY